MEGLKQWVASIILHKYLPVQYIVKGWAYLQGYRTQIFAVAWVVVFELSKYHVGLFADAELSKKLLEGLAGGASVTLMEKLKNMLPYVDEAIDTTKGGTK